MKKFLLLFTAFVLIGLSGWTQPSLYWQYNNVNVYDNLGTCTLAFDVEVSCDQAGTYAASMQLYFDYNPLAFGNNVVLNNNIVFTPGTLLSGEFMPGSPLYTVIGYADNTPSRFAVVTESNFLVPMAGFMNTIPQYPAFIDYFHIEMEIASEAQLAGIDFTPSLMDGGEYYCPAMGDEQKYGVPPDYLGTYVNNMLTTALVCSPCPPAAMWTGAVNNDWNTPGNWDVLFVPCITTDVTIPSGLTNYPTLSGPGECNNIYFHSNTGGTGTILDNGYLTVGGAATYERYYSTIIGGLFNDDFEDGNVSEYCQTNNFTASMDVANTGVWSGKSTSTATSHYSGGRICMAGETPEYISFWFYRSATTSATAYFVVSDGPSGGGTINQVIFMYITAGNFRIFGNPALTGPACTPNMWYHVEFANFDWTNRHFDWYINGSLIQAGILFRGANAMNIDNIDLYTYTSGTITYYDDIYVGNAGGGMGGPAWHLTSSPITDGLSGIYLGQYLQNYDETTMAWTDIIPVDVPMVPMKGYGFWAIGDNTAYYTGTLNTGVVSTSLTAVNPFGWNLLGNPYPSAIDWDLVSKPGYMNGAVYYLNAATGNYVSYNGGMGGGSRYVPPVQGFFVSATGPGTLTFDNSVRTHTGGSAYYKDETANALELVATGNGFADKTYIRFDENASTGFDGQFDAYKLFGLDYNILLPQLYTVSGDNLSINVQPEAKAIPLNFRAGVDGKFTIGIGKIVDIDYIYLRDLATGSIVNLKETGYTFDYKTGGNDARFMLHFSPFGENMDNVNIYSCGKDIFVSMPQDFTGDIYIYNTMGQLINTCTCNGTLTQIALNQSGNYIVKVTTNKGMETRTVHIE